MEGILILSVRYWTLLEDPDVSFKGGGGGGREGGGRDDRDVNIVTEQLEMEVSVGGAWVGSTESVTFYFCAVN